MLVALLGLGAVLGAPCPPQGHGCALGTASPGAGRGCPMGWAPRTSPPPSHVQAHRNAQTAPPLTPYLQSSLSSMQPG